MAKQGRNAQERESSFVHDLHRRGLAEEFTGKLILLLFFLLVAFLIYMLISGKFSHVAGGFEWIG